MATDVYTSQLRHHQADQPEAVEDQDVDQVQASGDQDTGAYLGRVVPLAVRCVKDVK